MRNSKDISYPLFFSFSADRKKAFFGLDCSRKVLAFPELEMRTRSNVLVGILEIRIPRHTGDVTVMRKAFCSPTIEMDSGSVKPSLRLCPQILLVL